MVKSLAFAMLALVAIATTSCGGEDSESTESESTAKNYVVLNVDGGDAIKVESDHVSWSNDHISGITQNYYQDDKFKLQFTDLSARIKDGPKAIHGQKFPIIITYKGQEYSTSSIIKDSKEEKKDDYLGTEYVLTGTIAGFKMDDKKVSGGEFAFSTYVKK
jgi:hypothetical protein